MSPAAFRRRSRTLLLSLPLFLIGSIHAARAVSVLPQGFATYVGLADCDGIAEWHGDLFLACHSVVNQLPGQGAELKPRESKGDAYVVRLNQTTGKLVYATLLGGNGYSAAFRIKVDRQGCAYATGVTRARDFPTTLDAVQRSFGGGESDAFVVKLAPDGRVLYSTFLGGTDAEESYGLDVDVRGGVFVAGTTWSADFPGQRKVHVATKGDAFVSYLRAGDPKSLRSVVFGGNQEEKLSGIALDGRGGLFAVGHTKSTNFPLIQPMQAGLKGAQNVFLVRLNARSLIPTLATYFGGSGEDFGWGVTVDRHGNPVVAGTTSSGDLPVAADAFQRAPKGGLDVFVAVFRWARHEVRVTYFGGSKDDSSGYDGDDVKVDSAGNVWVVGFTSSPDLPGTSGFPPQQGREANRGFVAAFSPSLAGLCFAVYDGGSEGEQLEGLALSSDGALALATGFSLSSEIPAEAVVDRQKNATRLNGHDVHTRVLAVPTAMSCR